MDKGANNIIRTEVCSPPDRKLLVVHIMVGNELFAEINRENGDVDVEVYRRRDGRSWTMTYDTLVSTLEEGRKKLVLWASTGRA